MRSPWYAQAKPLSNRPWSIDDRIHILQVRAINPDITALQIARGFPDLVSVPDEKAKNIIHNQIRLMKKVQRNECFQCGNPLTALDKDSNKPGRLLFLCLKCKDSVTKYKKGLRDLALEEGYCGSCRKKRVVKGKTFCDECLSITQRRRYNKGLCGRCGEKPLDKKSKAFCSDCLVENRAH